MAKQSGTVFFLGTIDDLTFYKMNGEYYVRKKSRLTGKRVKKDPQFENSRRNAYLFGRGAKLASKVYRQLPKKAKGHGVIGTMTAVAAACLRSGMSEQATLARMEQMWMPATKQAGVERTGALSLSRCGVTVKGALDCYPVPQGLLYSCKPIMQPIIVKPLFSTNATRQQLPDITDFHTNPE